ncbi:MAG: solute-binding protein, partial [Euryarchaeota archaeon]|nr:solute-binding protein [Euryarchaeota archaeon]
LKALAGGKPLRELARGIRGYEVEAKSHSAVAAAVAHGRADAGIAIRTVAEEYGLGFVPLREEKYDFAIPKQSFEKPAVRAFLATLASEEFRQELDRTPGLKATPESGKVIHRP